MKIKINGQTIDTNQINSIRKIYETELGTIIHFIFDIQFKNGSYTNIIVNTGIEYNLFSIKLPGEKRKWFASDDYYKNSDILKSKKEEITKMRSEIESLWSDNQKIIPEFSSKLK